MSPTAILETTGPAKSYRSRAVRNPARAPAVLEERRRIAREIHDTLAQGFAAIRLQLELARDVNDLPPQTAKALQLAYRIAGENLVDARRAMAELNSSRPCLAALLSAAVDGVRRLGATEIVATLDPVSPPPSNVAHELSRIAQEAMLNAMRHAGCNAIQLSLTRLAYGGLRLAVDDDGRGFDPAAPYGFGLAGLRDRAAMIGARLSIASTPGAGTQVAVTWIP
jgi:two-component system, NarL family, sensor kinase